MLGWCVDGAAMLCFLCFERSCACCVLSQWLLYANNDIMGYDGYTGNRPAYGGCACGDIQCLVWRHLPAVVLTLWWLLWIRQHNTVNTANTVYFPVFAAWLVSSARCAALRHAVHLARARGAHTHNAWMYLRECHHISRSQYLYTCISTYPHI